MKKTIKENATKSEKELKETLSAKREELFGIMMDVKQNKLKNTRSIYNTRKEIARLLTLIREKELMETEKVEAQTK
jgi:large subunit ribosomal protein L29